MALNPVQFQDCNLIVKTFEKGCHSSLTEASVFAPISGGLDFIRNNSRNISRMMESQSKNTYKRPVKNRSDSAALNEGQGITLGEIDEDGEVFNRLSEELSSKEVVIGIDTECIPCGVRIQFDDELNIKAGITPMWEQMYEMMEAWLVKALSQIRSVIDMFSNLDKYVDIFSKICPH